MPVSKSQEDRMKNAAFATTKHNCSKVAVAHFQFKAFNTIRGVTINPVNIYEACVSISFVLGHIFAN